MSVDYKALLQGNISVIEVTKAIARFYGGEHFKMAFSNESPMDFGMGPGIDQGSYTISFDQQFSEEVLKLRPWERKEHRIHRLMFVHTDGSCACDYADVTSEPMTYISLGHWGECKEIINALVYHFGGYIRDEAGEDEWVEMSREEHGATAERIQKRLAYLEERQAKYTN